MDLTSLAIAATPAFIASAVEFVEATTIVLAVGITRGWRAPLFGTGLAVLTLAVIVGALGVALVTIVPEHLLLGIVGTLAAGVIVTALAAALRSPLTAVPENWMKFGVGAMLSSFGVFWFGEGIGAKWPGDALSIPIIVAAFLIASWLSVRLLGVLVP